MDEDRRPVLEELLNCQVRKMRHLVFSVDSKMTFSDVRATLNLGCIEVVPGNNRWVGRIHWYMNLHGGHSVKSSPDLGCQVT